VSGDVVVDTSVFIDFLRSAERYSLLEQLIIDDRVVLSEVVRLELLAGVRKAEKFKLTKMLSPLKRRSGFPSVSACESLLNNARGSGLFGSIPDIMILADAVEERSALASVDQKLVRLAKYLGVMTVEVV
jgi:predicted nucleic acid-binding protein